MSGKKQPASPVRQIGFRYLKSNYFRCIHADGAVGGLSPDRNVHISFFNQRKPIPKKVVHTITDAGLLGPEILELRVSEEEIIREVDVDVIMTVVSAKSLVNWLKQKISEAEKLAEGARKLRKKPQGK